MKALYTSVLLATAFAGLQGLAGCTHFGPKSVPVDRFDYSTAISESWKQQTLLNIVKLRYMDLPVFVEVASIVSGYSMETSGNIGGQITSSGSTQTDNLMLGVAGKFIDRPTITYMPMTGEKFLRGLLMPIDPKQIFSMLQSGYAADFILALTVDSLNGVRNRSVTVNSVREADPEFLRVIELIRDVQAAGAVGMRVEDEKAKTAVLFFRRDDIGADIAEKVSEIKKILKLADRQKYVLTYSPVRGTEEELTVNSRSMMQVMGAFSSYLDVPEAHLMDHSAIAAIQNSTSDNQQKGVRIRSGKDKPADSFVAVQYRDHWFWIDNADWLSKRAMTAIVFFFTLTESGDNENMPLITIPAQ